MNLFQTASFSFVLMTSVATSQEVMGVTADGRVGARCILGYLVEMQASRELCELGTPEQREAIDEAVSATTARLVDLGIEGFSADEVDDHRARTVNSARRAVVGFGSTAAFCSNIEMVQSKFSVEGLRGYIEAVTTSDVSAISLETCSQM